MTDPLDAMWARWSHIQGSLFPWLREEVEPMTELLGRLITILDVIGLEAYVPGPPRGAGRPQEDRRALARRFVAKAMLGIPTTSALIERLKADASLRRIIGWERRAITGAPDRAHISTSLIERQNLTMRMSMRRFSWTILKTVTDYRNDDGVKSYIPRAPSIPRHPRGLTGAPRARHLWRGGARGKILIPARIQHQGTPRAPRQRPENMNVQPRNIKPPLKILLCSPRGFCAGVVRAIDAVERALAQFGPPVYVRHEIVHNRYVVESLKAKGAVFVEELEEIPDMAAPVIFSAHGVAKSVSADAVSRQLLAIDATCPLVTKVHREAEIHWRRGRRVLLVGHSGHPEVVGTMGQLPDGAVVLVESIDDIAALELEDENNLAYVTQTTLSLDDSRAIVEALTLRFPAIVGPHKEDICYATTNRQAAVKKVAPHVDAVIVVGSPNSSNSQRLREVAERSGAPAQLVQGRGEIDWSLYGAIASLGITAGASAPEVLVEEIMDAFAERFEITVETISAADEDVSFPLPKELRALA